MTTTDYYTLLGVRPHDAAQQQPDRCHLPLRALHPDRRIHPGRRARDLRGLRRHLRPEGRLLTLKRQKEAPAL
jgi:hypothetical protein